MKYIQICSFQIIFLLPVTIFFRGLLRGMLILAVIIKLPNVATKDLIASLLLKISKWLKLQASIILVYSTILSIHLPNEILSVIQNKDT